MNNEASLREEINKILKTSADLFDRKQHEDFLLKLGPQINGSNGFNISEYDSSNPDIVVETRSLSINTISFLFELGVAPDGIDYLLLCIEEF